jgi:PhnB protein
MRLDTYVNYAGTCEAAFRFYEQQLGGKITVLMTHEQQPNPAIAENWKKKILHARLEVGDAVLLGADIPGAEPMRSAYVTLTVDQIEEAERLYQLLADGGQVFMKMEKTFFASRFAMLRDRFGTSWMLLAGVQTPRSLAPYCNAAS